jgi:hypothetical protein
MILRSARQAWHDAYYTPWDSVMSHCQTMLQLGTDVQRSERDRSVGSAWHQVMAGKVQAAIKTLPPALQCFGHRLYAPSPTDIDCEAAHALIWSRFVFPAPVRAARREKVFYLADCAIVNQGLVVRGRDAMTPIQIRDWLEGERGIKLSSKHWGQDWERIWDRLRSVCDAADAECLRPVASVIAAQNSITKNAA